MLKVNNNQEYKLSQSLEAGEWNALALVYNENDTEGTVAVYPNGEEVLPATGVGFKLSERPASSVRLALLLAPALCAPACTITSS